MPFMYGDDDDDNKTEEVGRRPPGIMYDDDGNMVAIPTPGMTRHNHGKPKMSLLPVPFQIIVNDSGALPILEVTAEVLTFGAKKYAAHNWRKAGPWSEVLNSAYRHIHAIKKGETVDAESQIDHFGHVGCNLAFLLEFVVMGQGENDLFLYTDEQQDKIPAMCLQLAPEVTKQDAADYPFVNMEISLWTFQHSGKLEDLQTAINNLAHAYQDSINVD